MRIRTTVCPRVSRGSIQSSRGGLLPNRSYLIRGGSGTGKTTVGFHFLTAEPEDGDRSLFISLGESESNVKQNEASVGIDLSHIDFLDLSPGPEYFSEAEAYDIFSPAEVEREPITRRILHKVEGLKPARVFVNSVTQFSYLSSDVYQYRRQVFSFIQFLAEHGAPVLFSSEAGPENPDEDLQFLSQGMISLVFTPAGRSPQKRLDDLSSSSSG